MSSSIFPQREVAGVESKVPSKQTNSAMASYSSRNSVSNDSVEGAGYSHQSSHSSVGNNTTSDANSHALQRTPSTPGNKFVRSNSGATPERGHNASESLSGHRPTSHDDQHSDLLSSFTTEKITYGKWLGCVVSHVDDPETFYCQLEGDNNVEMLESLMDRVEKYITSLPPGIGVLRTAALGQPVVAKYSVDGNWYRARVTGM